MTVDPPEEFFSRFDDSPSNVHALFSGSGVDAVAPSAWERRITAAKLSWLQDAPPKRRWLFVDKRDAARVGVFPRGKVGLIIAEGGAGKTMALVQCAIAVATKTAWVGALQCPEEEPPGRVLMLAAEEDEEELRRRVWQAGNAIGLTEDQQMLAAENVVFLPLAGVPCAMIDRDQGGNLFDSAFLIWLRAYLQSSGPWDLIIVDPFSRFAGLDAEKDNACATRAVQALESLKGDTSANILLAHHLNKVARGSGARVDANASRGSSALTDGVRWVISLSYERVEVEGEGPQEMVTVSFVKSNYSKRGEPVLLGRDSENGGALIPFDDEMRSEMLSAKEKADPSVARNERQSAVAKEQMLKDAFTLALILLDMREVSRRDLGAEMRKRLGRCATSRVDVAISYLDQGVLRLEDPAHKQRLIFRLNRDGLPDDIKSRLPAPKKDQHASL